MKKINEYNVPSIERFIYDEASRKHWVFCFGVKLEAKGIPAGFEKKSFKAWAGFLEDGFALVASPVIEEVDFIADWQ